MKSLALCMLLYAGCSPDESSQVADAAPDVTRAPAVDAPLEYSDPPRPCGRTTVFVIDGGHTWELPLPCRPYDRARDLADPQP